MYERECGLGIPRIGMMIWRLPFEDQGFPHFPMICLAGLKLKALERGDGIGQGKGVVRARHHMVGI